MPEQPKLQTITKTTTVDGVNRQKWTARKKQNLKKAAWSTPSDFVAFTGVRYTNVKGRSHGAPDYKISSPKAINTTVL